MQTSCWTTIFSFKGRIKFTPCTSHGHICTSFISQHCFMWRIVLYLHFFLVLVISCSWAESWLVLQNESVLTNRFKCYIQGLLHFASKSHTFVILGNSVQVMKSYIWIQNLWTFYVVLKACSDHYDSLWIIWKKTKSYSSYISLRILYRNHDWWFSAFACWLLRLSGFQIQICWQSDARVCNGK